MIVAVYPIVIPIVIMFVITIVVDNILVKFAYVYSKHVSIDQAVYHYSADDVDLVIW